MSLKLNTYKGLNLYENLNKIKESETIDDSILNRKLKDINIINKSNNLNIISEDSDYKIKNDINLDVKYVQDNPNLNNKNSSECNEILSKK